MDRIYKYYKEKHVLLTKTEKKIAEYVIKNPKKVIVLSALELGKEIGVSDASVLRFSQTLGFKKFSDLKNYIAEELGNDLTPDDRIVTNWDNFNSKNDLVNKIINADLENIRNFLLDIDFEELNRCIDMLEKAKKIYFMGLGSSRGISQYMNWYFKRMGFNTETISEGGLGLYEIISNLKEEDLIFIFSFPRILVDEVRALKFAKEKKVKIVAITSNIFSEISLVSDIVFKVSVNNHGFFNSYSVPIELCNLILTMIFEKNKTEIYNNLKDNKHIKDFLFIKDIE